MAPPWEAALLLRVLLLMVSVPLLRMAPPPEAALLLRVLLLMVSVPLLRIAPPPMKEGKGGGETAPTPWAMVRALRVKLTPPFTESTCTLLPPSRVTDCPLPSRVMLPEIVSVLVMTISALQLKVMTSLALSLLAVLTSACSWLSFLQLVTVRVVCACAGRVSPPGSAHRPMSKANPHSRRTLAERRVGCG